MRKLDTMFITKYKLSKPSLYKHTRYWRLGSAGLVSERKVTVLCVSS